MKKLGILAMMLVLSACGSGVEHSYRFKELSLVLNTPPEMEVRAENSSEGLWLTVGDGPGKTLKIQVGSLPPVHHLSLMLGVGDESMLKRGKDANGEYAEWVQRYSANGYVMAQAEGMDLATAGVVEKIIAGIQAHVLAPDLVARLDAQATEQPPTPAP